MQICSQLFRNFKVEDKISIGNLELFPINVDLRLTPENVRSLPELMEAGSVIITEIDESGNVEKARVTNSSEFYLFIMDGEALIGAKQNRIAQKSVIIPPNCSINLPVNCVERSRWSSGMQGSFKRGDFALPPSAREKKGKLLKSKMNMLIQESVWDSVDDIAAKKETFSPTADLGEILASSRDIADDISNANISEIDCNGFVVFGAGRPFIEIFYDETVCKLHQPTSQKAWLADASETSDQSKTKKDATTLLEQLSQSFWSTEDPVGYETAFSSEEHNNGRIVLKDDAFIHGYFYA